MTNTTIQYIVTLFEAMDEETQNNIIVKGFFSLLLDAADYADDEQMEGLTRIVKSIDEIEASVKSGRGAKIEHEGAEDHLDSAIKIWNYTRNAVSRPLMHF